MNIGIKDKVALVTGASKGIGRAIALKLAEEGARVAIVARTADTLLQVAGQLTGPVERHAAFPLDLMTTEGLESLVLGLRGGLGEPDIIVHNLGGSMGVFNPMAPVEDWRKVWQYNVGIVHELNRVFLPGMVKRGWGRVVHLSTLSTTTYNGAPAYVSAKCALDGYVKSVNREFSKHNVILSAVAPGAIYSEGRHFAKLARENPAALQDYFKNHLPIQRLGTAEDISPVVAFLCSDHASFLAGTIIGVDGGGM
ncbi:MAG: hypothetical protein RLZZ129_2245 [Verrucomicrobiota bacterium]|jgi:3-oxoacyl-[acyl-carrier protein] reductase